MCRKRYTLIVIFVMSILVSCTNTENIDISDTRRCPLDCELWSEDENTCLRWSLASSGGCNEPVEYSTSCCVAIERSKRRHRCSTYQKEELGSACTCEVNIEGKQKGAHGRVCKRQ